MNEVYGKIGCIKTYELYLKQCKAYKFIPMSKELWQAKAKLSNTKENQPWKT